MEQVSEEDLRDMFDMLDSDQSGALDIQEFGMAVRALGLNPSDELIQQLFTRADINEDEKIDFDEFLRLYSRCERKNKVNKQALMEQLSPYDRNGDGRIDQNELYEILCQGGEPLTKKEVRKILRQFDVSGDGYLSIEELVDGLLQTSFQVND